MAFQGIDLTVEAGQASTSISWHDPHPIFAIILVGKEEIPFGIQKDLLCAQSPYYRDEFAKNKEANSVEMIVKLPDTDVETFGCFQNFIYTGHVYDKAGGRPIPDYPLLMSVWKLAIKLKMAPLRIAVLDCMAERRRLTGMIPGTPLLIQAWEETEEGSGLRMMLIGWAAEHMRASPEIRNAFAKSLPQGILSELVIVMSDLPATPAFTPQPQKHSLPIDLEAPRPVSKKSRKSEPGPAPAAPGPDDAFEAKPIVKKAPRKSEPAVRKPPRKSNVAHGEVTPLSAEADLEYCRGLIHRMVSGPGYWTRLVGPFRNPVDPVLEQIPNYLTVVKRPMDLKTIKAKMERNEYVTSAEFEKDVRQIFYNCYEYWTQDDPIFKKCEDFEKYFNEQWNARHGWKPTIKAEVID